MLLHSTRYDLGRCPSNRFDHITSQCLTGSDTEPYGVDPVFKRGTSLFNPELDPQTNPEQLLVFYNCSSQVSYCDMQVLQ